MQIKNLRSLHQKTWDVVGNCSISKKEQFYATREIPVYERVLGFYGNLIQIDHTGAHEDASNPNLKRYLRIENDPSIGWSVVGSGTKHKYLLYFNGQFPFVHQIL